jgi:hypothetical protein
LKDHTEAFHQPRLQGAVLFDNTLADRTDALATSIIPNTAGLDKTLKDRTRPS